MATLNTLRTKYGIVLSVLIAIVLLAFILGDQLNYRATDQEIVDEVVMTVDGKEVKQSEYYPIREMYSQFQQLDEDAVADRTASTIVYNNYFAPALRQIGVMVSAAEVDAYAKTFGEMTAMQLRQYGWPDEQIVPIVQNQWAMESLSAEQTIAMESFSKLLTAGAYVNRLEVEDQLRGENLTFDGRYVALPYATIANDAVEITDEEVAAYYEAHRIENRNYGSRMLRYVRFDIDATDEDKATIEKEIKALDENVKAAADVEAQKSVVRTAGGKVGTYKSFASLDSAVAEALNASKSYGPELDAETWKAYYLLADVNAPATYEFEVAQFANMAEAEKIAEELKANGGDFTKLSTAVEAVADSRELINMTESQAKNFIACKEGDIFAFSNNGVPAVAKIVKLGQKERFVLTADVEKAITPSEDTIRSITREADSFEGAAGQDVESFQAAADAAGRTIAMVNVNRNDYNPMYGRGRLAGNIPNSRHMAVWAYGAEVGDIKRFSIDGSIYVVMVASVDNEKFAPRNDVQIRQALLRDKKYEMLTEKLAMDATIEGAESGTFAGVKYADRSLNEGKGDATLVAAIASSDEGVETKVKGTTAAYIFVVDKINGEVDATTLEEERTPLITQRENATMQSASGILSMKTEIEDFRAEGSI